LPTAAGVRRLRKQLRERYHFPDANHLLCRRLQEQAVGGRRLAGTPYYRADFDWRVVPFLRANFRRNPPLDEIAAVAGLSPFHFQRLFTSAYGRTPRRFLLDLRIEAAKAMLLDGRPLAEVAAALAFAHASHFVNAFRAEVGITPARWRRHALQLGRQPSGLGRQAGPPRRRRT
jgi:AraC-like DNA-binding protein